MIYSVFGPSGHVAVYALFADGEWRRWYSYLLRDPYPSPESVLFALAA